MHFGLTILASVFSSILYIFVVETIFALKYNIILCCPDTAWIQKSHHGYNEDTGFTYKIEVHRQYNEDTSPILKYVGIIDHIRLLYMLSY